MKTLSKVFLCLKTNMYNVEGEHITLRYYRETSWHDLIEDARRFSKHLPDTIMVRDYGTWNTETERFVGARLQSSGIFDEAGLTMPHITLEKHPDNYGRDEFLTLYQPNRNTLPYELVTTLYLGKKINGKLEFMPIDSRQIYPETTDYLFT